MTGLGNLIRRNCKLFFKDKGTFFTSLITPLILLVLYATFLMNVYRDSLLSSIPDFITLSDKVINGVVGGELFSSLLAVSSVTVAFCSNMIMVQDKVSGARQDLTVTPVKKSTLSLSYYIATLVSTLIICFTATAVSMIYLLNVGCYTTVWDLMMILLDVFLLALFGISLSSIINTFLSTQGQISAVGTIVSSAYGFICGAYMPISQFSDGLQRVISFMPGTYATSLLRNHAMRGALSAMENEGVPLEMINEIKKSIDCTPLFFSHEVPISATFVILIVTDIVLIGAYILLGSLKKTKK